MPRKPKAARRDAGLPSKQRHPRVICAPRSQAPASARSRAPSSIKGGDRIAPQAAAGRDGRRGPARWATARASRSADSCRPWRCCEIVARDADGELIAEPAVWDAGEGDAPARAGARLARRTRSAEPALGQGDRILARLTRLEERRRLRLPLRGRADQAPAARAAPPARHLPRQGGRRRRSSTPSIARSSKEWPIAPGDEGDAADGDLVRFELSRTHRFGVPAGARRRDARQPAGPAQDQPDRRARARHPRRVSRTPCSPRWRQLEPPKLAGPHRPARPRPRSPSIPSMPRDHDDAVHAAPDADAGEQRRLGRARGHRRRRPLRAARHQARPRGADARQLRSTSPTASCRCCPSASPTTCARCRSGEERPASPCAWCSTGTATRRATPSCAP